MFILIEIVVDTKGTTQRYGANKNDVSGVHKSIRLRIGQGRPEQVKSVFDLAIIILDECSNAFFDRTRISHDGYHRSTHSKQPRVLESFSEAIGNIVRIRIESTTLLQY